MANADDRELIPLDALISAPAQLSAQIRQLLAAQRGLGASNKSIADEAQELIDDCSAAELRGDNPIATSKLEKLLKEHHQVSERILSILHRSRAR